MTPIRQSDSTVKIIRSVRVVLHINQFSKNKRMINYIGSSAAVIGWYNYYYNWCSGSPDVRREMLSRLLRILKQFCVALPRYTKRFSLFSVLTKSTCCVYSLAPSPFCVHLPIPNPNPTHTESRPFWPFVNLSFFCLNFIATHTNIH